MFDLLEEKLNLPTFFIEIGNRLGSEMKEIGEEHVVFARLAIVIADATQRRHPDTAVSAPTQGRERAG